MSSQANEDDDERKIFEQMLRHLNNSPAEDWVLCIGALVEILQKLIRSRWKDRPELLEKSLALCGKLSAVVEMAARQDRSDLGTDLWIGQRRPTIETIIFLATWVIEGPVRSKAREKLKDLLLEAAEENGLAHQVICLIEECRSGRLITRELAETGDFDMSDPDVPVD